MGITKQYEQRVKELLDDFPHWVITGGFENVGYAARRRNPKNSKGYGPPVAAMTLDGLAEIMDREDDADRERAAAEKRADRIEAERAAAGQQPAAPFIT